MEAPEGVRRIEDAWSAFWITGEGANKTIKTPEQGSGIKLEQTSFPPRYPGLKTTQRITNEPSRPSL